MPASVPDCAGLHTPAPATLRARIVLDGDLGCLADLLDDQEAAVPLDHANTLAEQVQHAQTEAGVRPKL